MRHGLIDEQWNMLEDLLPNSTSANRIRNLFLHRALVN